MALENSCLLVTMNLNTWYRDWKHFLMGSCRSVLGTMSAQCRTQLSRPCNQSQLSIAVL